MSKFSNDPSENHRRAGKSVGLKFFVWRRGAGVGWVSEVVNSIIRPRLGRTSDTSKCGNRAPRAPRTAPRTPRNAEAARLGRLERHLGHLETVKSAPQDKRKHHLHRSDSDRCRKVLSLFPGCFFGSFDVSEVPLVVPEACGSSLWGTARSLSVACVLGLQVLCSSLLHQWLQFWARMCSRGPT